MRNLSFWEQQTWCNDIDFAIIGSGIVGLSCALQLRERFPKAKIMVFERGILPSGASTKNAGFACFGSVSEILDDLNTHSEDEVIQLIRSRRKGLELLRKQLGDTTIDYKQFGGYELFSLKDARLYEKCTSQVPYVNKLVNEAYSDKNDAFSIKNDSFSFKNIQKQVIYNQFEGQIDTGKMMQGLIKKASEKGIFILNGVEIASFSARNDKISLFFDKSNVTSEIDNTYSKEEVSVKKLFIATNGFAKQFLEEDIQPARAQVVVTKPIPNLKIKGTFHLEKGYYYFRNINNRILFGGGRNLDFETENTSNFGLTKVVQDKLETILKTTILPDIPFEIDTRWSGIMGVGSQKKAIVKTIAPNVHCGVRLGGMGIAIGSTIGKELANKA